MENDKKIIDLSQVLRLLWSKKKLFVKVWVATFILSCIWILPQPRYYVCDVKLAPEAGGEDVAGGLSSIASSFGLNLGGAGNDAIYPMLYPDLLQSPEFTVELFDIKVESIEGDISTDYYTYLSKHQKKNVLFYPFRQVSKWISELLDNSPKRKGGEGHDAFRMTKREQQVAQTIQKHISCSVDKKTDVISLSVKDQDPLICATLADSVMEHLQNFIIAYRTKKARLDESYYQNLADSARQEYYNAQMAYSDYCDAHRDIILQSSITERDRLENDLSITQNTYQAMMTQLQAMKAKVQEKTPTFTTLQSATVPIKPSEPKRMLFVAAMLVLASLITAVWQCRGLMSKQ